MICRSLLTAAFMLVGTAAVGESALAQSVDVNFTGTVQGSCSFGAVTNGNLAAEGSGSTGVVILSSKSSGGSAGQVTVNCNQPAGLQVSIPIQTGGPSGNQAGAYVSSGAYSIRSGVYSSTGFDAGPSPSPVTGPLPISPGASRTVTVQMSVTPAPGNTNLQPGNYAYKVTLTITN
ncbi:hypothetical protein NIES4074_02970 [Cylindrospermum sp. NIES-4074]|nr:hypothetical protein NIES4074_02970 [Cylindrospermum sp. NIES-4074]